MNSNQINAELEAYASLINARNVLEEFADKADSDPGADPELGKIWDELRTLKTKFACRLLVKGVLGLEDPQWEKAE